MARWAFRRSPLDRLVFFPPNRSPSCSVQKIIPKSFDPFLPHSVSLASSLQSSAPQISVGEQRHQGDLVGRRSSAIPASLRLLFIPSFPTTPGSLCNSSHDRYDNLQSRPPWEEKSRVVSRAHGAGRRQRRTSRLYGVRRAAPRWRPPALASSEEQDRLLYLDDMQLVQHGSARSSSSV